MVPAQQRARRAWELLEPIHAITYFAPECRAAYADAGLKGFWMGYFAGRAVSRWIEPGSTVALAGGRSIQAMVQNMKPALAKAFLRHSHVALLKDFERQDSARKQYRVEREDRHLEGLHT